jgi:V-type H+-transporting ATPase subunit a
MDPTWYRATQEINVMNSLKMKMAVIYGVAQMSLGTLMKGFNALYFKRYGEFLFDFLSQIFLILVLFGFMDYLIIAKWTTNWDELTALPENQGKVAPAIIDAMIMMFIKGGKREETSIMLPVIPNEQKVMNQLLLIALICVPTMLLANPIVQLVFGGKKSKHVDEIELADMDKPSGNNSSGYAPVNGSNEIHELAKDLMSKDHDSHGFGEMMIHQMIETIEYSLGTVSNTASYLRLWALSLAHG